MKNAIIAMVLVGFICCTKERRINQFSSPLEDTYLALVQSSLQDSLSPADYRNLDFSQSIASGIDSLHIRLLRIPLAGKPITADFFVVRTDEAGHIFSGRFITIQKDTAETAAFTGRIIYRSMKWGAIKAIRLVKGRIQKPGGPANQLVAEPEMDGGDLPPVVVSASYGSGGISYADWYNLLDMAGGDGYGYTGYYSPSSGGGGGGSSSAPTAQVDFEAPESKAAIDIAQYIKCFGGTQSADADYTVTIAVDLPVDNDPNAFFNWSDASPGHTFIELYKNDNGNLVQQNIGFYPNSSWKVVTGPDNIGSKIADDAGHEYQAKYTIAVSATGFQQALNAAKTYASHDYNVAEFNCADYALRIFTAAGGSLNVPQFQLPSFPSTDGSNSPQGVYDAIQSLELAGKPGAFANGQKQWTGDSHGACN